MIKDPHFPDFLSDLEIYVDNLASSQIRNMNKYIEHNRAMIKNKYALSDSDHYMRSLKAALIDEDNYFNNLLGNDISAIAKICVNYIKKIPIPEVMILSLTNSWIPARKSRKQTS